MAERFNLGLRNEILDALATRMANGIMAIYSGSPPATPDLAETGTLLALITLSSGAFEAGVSTNGINFGTASGGVLAKATGETWSGLGLAAAGTGTPAGYFRHYANAYVTGISTAAERYDGQIGTTTAYELRMTNTVITEGQPITVTSYSITLPEM